VLDFKLRAGLMVALGAMMLLGSLSATPAFAEGGPFCHEREAGGKGEGKLISESSPEQIQGTGGVQKLVGKVLGLSLELESQQAQVKGIIYDNEDQCQIKVLIDYGTPKVVTPSNDAGCEVKINTQNSVKLFGHQAWKWNGEKKQLEEPVQKAIQHRDWIFLPVELQQGATGLPKTETPFATITLKGSTECAVPGEFPVSGSASAEGFKLTGGKEPKQELEEFGTEEEVTTSLNGGAGPQHFWNGSAFIGVQTGLFIGTTKEAAKYKGAYTIKPIGRQQGVAAQEIGYFEK
jgi:hypothetical protein